MMPGTLDGKVALVTGGASGIGRAAALAMARQGAILAIADMNEDGGRQTVHMITETGGDATFLRVDVTSAAQVEAMISSTVDAYGPGPAHLENSRFYKHIVKIHYVISPQIRGVFALFFKQKFFGSDLNC